MPAEYDAVLYIFFQTVKEICIFYIFLLLLAFFIIQNINSGSALCEGIFQKKIVFGLQHYFC